MSPLLVIFLTVFIDMVGFGIVIPVLPLYAEHFHATPVQIGWLTGIYSGMQIIFTPILGRLSDRFGRRPVLIVSLIGTAIGFLIMGWAASLASASLSARIIDGASGGNISTAQAYIADVSTPENRSRSMGLIGAAFGLGFTFGPMIGGIMSRISYGAPFYFAAALAAHQRRAALFHSAGKPFRRTSLPAARADAVSRKSFSTATAAFSAPSWPPIFSPSPVSRS